MRLNTAAFCRSVSVLHAHARKRASERLKARTARVTPDRAVTRKLLRKTGQERTF